jgi:hypothetical protein
MLKVGFVEVLQFGKGWFHELVLGSMIPKELRKGSDLEFRAPPYVNAPGCETCDVSSISKGVEAYRSLRPAHEAAIRVAGKGPIHTSTKGDHSPGLIIFVAQELGLRLPQPAYLESPNEDMPVIPEEIAPDEEFEEGAVTQVLVNRYERDRAARARCIKHYGTNCIICGLSMEERYGPAVTGLIHVHHIEPISSIGKQALVDPVRKLRPVCPNCHAVIHSTKPARTIELVREMLAMSAKKNSRRDPCG